MEKKITTGTEFVPPGHYYSPIPALLDIYQYPKGPPPEVLPGINLNTKKQLQLLKKLEPFYSQIPFNDQKNYSLRYYYVNQSYSYSDAILLYCMIRYLEPKNFIEIGSGFSSALTLDTNQLFFKNSMNCTFIEPYPELLNTLILEEDKASATIINKKLQEVPVKAFSKLSKNDILFIDSTHVSKYGSDVNYLFYEILPSLKRGVYIHFHDVFYPFEYPEEWLLEGRAWNEQYLLRAFLLYNSKFEIVLFNTYLHHFYKEILYKKFPLAEKNPGGSIWLKKK